MTVDNTVLQQSHKIQKFNFVTIRDSRKPCTDI